MDPRIPLADGPAARKVEQELELVREAIVMVASGGSRRVVVAGLSLSDALIEPAQRMALEAGVRIVPLWSADESGADIAVERIAE
jgi:hypothetical protein